MLKLNLDGRTFDRGMHKNAIQFMTKSASIYAHQFNMIMSTTDTYTRARKEGEAMTRVITRLLNGMYQATVVKSGEAIAYFYSSNRAEVERESRAFQDGTLGQNEVVPPTQPVDTVKQGLQRKVAQQRREIERLKSLLLKPNQEAVEVAKKIAADRLQQAAVREARNIPGMVNWLGAGMYAENPSRKISEAAATERRLADLEERVDRIYKANNW